MSASTTNSTAYSTANLKAAIRRLAPAPLVSAFERLTRLAAPFKERASARDFMNWWQELRSSGKLPAELSAMVDDYIHSQSIRASSQYWNFLNKRNLTQLADHGFETFKQTVATNYFTFLGQLESGYSANLIRDPSLHRRALPLSTLLKRHALLSPEASLQFNVVTALLYECVRANPLQQRFPLYDEPLEGSPPFIEIEGMRVSQDMLNATLDLYAIDGLHRIDTLASVIEVGAGSGRTSHALLRHGKGIRKYVIVDIPPALYISQRSLTTQFPALRAFTFRPFERWSEVRAEFEQATLCFLMPQQAAEMARESGLTFDLFLAVDCLHEMTPDVIEGYFAMADRVAREMYFKCWQKTKLPFDQIELAMKDYPVRRHWTEVFRRTTIVPSDFFEAGYRITG